MSSSSPSSLYFAPHKCGQVQPFDESIQQLQFISSKQFLECLHVSDNVLPSKTLNSLLGLSIDGFCSLANHIARSIKEKRKHCLLSIYLFLMTH
jgi:DNA recombination-dependent growth factor C